MAMRYPEAGDRSVAIKAGGAVARTPGAEPGARQAVNGECGCNGAMTITYRLVAAPTAELRATAEQAAVVNHRQGALIVLGASRTGKSTALYQAGIAALRAHPEQRALLVVGSRAARLRAIGLIAAWAPEVAPRLTVMTAHGLGWSIVTRYAGRPVRLLTAGRQDAHVRQLLAGVGPGFWPADIGAAVAGPGFADQVREQVADLSRLGRQPADLAREAERAGRPDWAALAEFYQQYLDVLALESAYDYPGVLLQASAFLADPAIVAAVRPAGTLILADNTEDMAEAQLSLLDRLIDRTTPVIVAVDPDSQVDGFRGAERRSVMALRPGWTERGIAHQTTVLTRGFGVPGAVERALRPQVDRLGLPTGLDVASLRAYRRPTPDHTGQIDRYVWADTLAEAAGIARLLRRAELIDGVDPGDMAVIVRHKAHLAAYELALVQAGLSVQILGDELQLNREPMVLTLLMELRTRASQPAGDGSPHPAVDEVLWQIWSDGGWEARLLAEAESTGPVARQANRDLDAAVALFDMATALAAWPLAEAVAALEAEIAGQTVPEDIARPVAWSAPAVRLTTAHRAKGSTWSWVVVAGVQADVWPGLRSGRPVIDLTGLDPPVTWLTVAEQVAAERRLFAVAARCARDRLIVTAVANDDTRPSAFFEQIDTADQLPPTAAGALSAPELIADLRRVVSDDAQSPSLRQAAAERLVRVARSVDARADPARWWAVDPAWRHPRPDQPVEPRWSTGSPASADPPPGPVSLAISQVDAILACPRQWRLRVPAGSTTPASAVGSLIHDLVRQSDDGLDHLVEALEAAWPELDWPSDWAAQAGLERARQMLARYDAWRRAGARQVVASEVGVTQVVDLPGGAVTLRGRLDRVELDRSGRVWIVDFKTGKQAPSQAETNAHRQLGLYQVTAMAGALDGLGVERSQVAGAELVYLSLDQGRGSTLAKTRRQASLADQPYLDDEPALPALNPAQASAIASQRRYPTWVHQQAAAARTILTGADFPAVAGAHCRWCGVRDTCPAIGVGL